MDSIVQCSVYSNGDNFKVYFKATNIAIKFLFKL